MHNFFITQYFDWNTPSRRVRILNSLLKRMGYSARFVTPHGTGTMTNVEQRINMYHLLGSVLTFGVSGEVVEFGTNYGGSAALMQKVIDAHDPSRRLHVYDAFEDPPVDKMLANVRSLGLREPVVHAGWFCDTLPAQLPEQICFAHIDIASGGVREELERNLRFVFDCVYPRLSKGAVCLLADYCRDDVYESEGFEWPFGVARSSWWHLYPEVKNAADAFLADKPEKVCQLFAAAFSHGYFRKA